MAGYRQHLQFSTLCGVGYGAAAAYLGGFTPAQSAIAGGLTGVAGMLPDLDSESGRPVRELTGLVAAMTPIVAVRHLVDVTGSVDGMILAAGVSYLVVRYGGAWLIGKLAVRRGMFHSVPALAIAALLAFLAYKSDDIRVRVLMAGGVGLGYLSHLVLDEIYAVQWNGVRVRLNKFSGSALKCFGKSFPANAFSYGVLFFLAYAAMVKAGVMTGVGSVEDPPPPAQLATEIEETRRL